SKHYLTSSIVELTTVGKDSSINRINEKLKSFGKWTAQSIDERQAMLIELASEVWKTSGIVKTASDNSQLPSTDDSATISAERNDEKNSPADSAQSLSNCPDRRAENEEHGSDYIQSESKKTHPTKWTHDSVFHALVQRKERVKTSPKDR